MIPALRKGIYTLATTATGLDSTNVYYGKAPEAKTGIFCVFYGITDELDFDSGYKDEITSVQFSFFGTNLTSLETVVESFKSVMDFGYDSLTVSGWTIVDLRREISIPAQRVEDVYQVIMQYRFRIDKSRS